MGMKVFIKGLGDVNFPDGMSPDDVTAAVRKGMGDGSLELAAGLPQDPASRQARSELWGGNEDYFHGSTHNINEFDGSLGNEGGDWGAGTYATNSTEDAVVNYAGEGPDLTGRLEQKADEIRDWIYQEPDARDQLVEKLGGRDPTEVPEADVDAAIMDMAREDLVGDAGGGTTYPLKINTDNYARVGRDPTYLEQPNYRQQAIDEGEILPEDFEDDWEYADALDNRAYELEDIGGDSVLAQVQEALQDTDAYQNTDGINAVIAELGEAVQDGRLSMTDLDQAIRENMYDNYTDAGELVSPGGISAQAMKNLGYDGVIDQQVAGKFSNMEGVWPDTEHVVTFPGKENRIRSKFANFDPSQAGSSDMLKAAAPAAVGLGAAVGGTEEAEARIPYSRIAHKLGDYDSRFTPRKLDDERLRGLDLVTESSLPEIPVGKLADYQGRPFITTMADRTAAAEILTQINDAKLKTPLHLRGGQDYMFDPQNLGQVWASAPQPVKMIVKLAQEMEQKTGQPAVLLPWRMAPQGGDFASMTGEAMLAYADTAMKPRAKQRLNKMLKTVIPDWPGLDDPGAVQAFRNAPDKARKYAKNAMDTKFRDQGGLSIGEARLAVTDPKQLTAPQGGLQNLGSIDTSKEIITDSGHPAYPHAVPGQGEVAIHDPPIITDMLGEGTTRWEGEEGKFVTSDWAGDRNVPMGMPRANDIRSLQMKPYAGVLDDRTLQGLRDIGYETGNADPALLGGLAAVGAGGAALAAPDAEAGRLQRAVDAGYDTSKTYYRGTRTDDGPVLETGRAGQAFFADDPAMANNYSGDGSSPGANIGQYFLRKGETFDPAANPEHRAELEQAFNDAGGWEELNPDWFEDNGRLSDAQPDDLDWELMDQLGPGWLEERGYKSVRQQEYEDGGVSTAVFDPSDARSVNAQFEDTESGNVLGAVAPAAVGAGAAMSPDPAQAGTIFNAENLAPIQVGQPPPVEQMGEQRPQPAPEPTLQEKFYNDLQGVGVAANAMTRGMAGMSLGGLKALWDLAGGATYSDAVQSIDDMTALAFEGFEPTPEMLQNMQGIMEQTDTAARDIFGDTITDTYMTGFERAGDAAAERFNQWGYPQVGAGVGAAIRAGEMLSPI